MGYESGAIHNSVEERKRAEERRLATEWLLPQLGLEYLANSPIPGHPGKNWSQLGDICGDGIVEVVVGLGVSDPGSQDYTDTLDAARAHIIAKTGGLPQ